MNLQQFFLQKKNLLHHKMKVGMNHNKMDEEEPQRQCKDSPHDWWVATKEAEWATIAFSE